jgi:prepilin-type N-terminal cleavage/methylation domain-containing protein
MARKMRKSEKGITLIEVLVSLAVFSIIAVAVLGSLGTSSKVVNATGARETAKNLAESQMEYIKGLDYAASYTAAPVGAEYNGFTPTINTTAQGDNYLQKITISITWGSQNIYTLEGYKVR